MDRKTNCSRDIYSCLQVVYGELQPVYDTYGLLQVIYELITENFIRGHP